jgi:hypothetical protein
MLERSTVRSSAVDPPPPAQVEADTVGSSSSPAGPASIPLPDHPATAVLGGSSTASSAGSGQNGGSTPLPAVALGALAVPALLAGVPVLRTSDFSALPCGNADDPGSRPG